MDGRSRPALAFAAALSLVIGANIAFAEDNADKAEPPAANTAMLAATVAMDDRLNRGSFIGHAGVKIKLLPKVRGSL